MIKLLVCFASLFILTGSQAFSAEFDRLETFEEIVDHAGNIKVPSNYRTDWSHLGTFSIAEESGESKPKEFHNVYTQPLSVRHFRQSGEFPDGAVLVKELFQTEMSPLSTGRVSWAVKNNGWFVMVKNTKGRFNNHPNWGNGWGWAFFKADNPNTNVTKNFKRECIPCHVPAKETDWVYSFGYPVLQ